MIDYWYFSRCKPLIALAIAGNLTLLGTLANGQGPTAPAQGTVATQVSAEYTLGSEDVVTVTVLRHPEFSGDFAVPPSGTIQVPGVGDIDVRGMSLTDLNKKITAKLNDRLFSPEVTVSLKVARMQRFFVLGDVQHSGVYDLKPGWSIAEGLSTAGGLITDLQTSDARLTLTHAGTQKTVKMSLDQALAKSSDDDLKIEPGDVLRIEAIPRIPVYVTGKVKNPGLYRLREDANDVLAAISEAGGVGTDAALGNIRIVHLAGPEQVVDLAPALVRGESTKLPHLASGDMVVVAESLRTFAVLGYVAKPGNYPIPEGHNYSLSDALALAEGSQKRGRLTQVGLIRTENGKQDKKVFDLSKYLHGGDATQNPEILSGDVVFVPETNHAEPSTILGALSSVALFFNILKR